MRTFQYAEYPEGLKTMTEEEILRDYMPYWIEQMKKAGRPPEMITKENCIEDWITIHWAYEIWT